jgi:hypothetical protein
LFRFEVQKTFAEKRLSLYTSSHLLSKTHTKRKMCVICVCVGLFERVAAKVRDERETERERERER